VLTQILTNTIFAAPNPLAETKIRLPDVVVPLLSVFQHETKCGKIDYLHITWYFKLCWVMRGRKKIEGFFVMVFVSFLKTTAKTQVSSVTKGQLKI
jgi:hypothetical protein